MADALDYFKSEKKKHVDRAQELLEGAKKEARSPTEDERAEIESNMTQATEFAHKIQDAEDNKNLEASIARLSEAMSSEPHELGPPEMRSSHPRDTRLS
jgi:F0F1-type ATP synthase membrane subunit b/b'